VYPSVRDPRLRAGQSQRSGGQDRRWLGVSSNVVFLGLTSLFTDVSSEMVTAILPIYLTFELRFSPLQFGVFDGLYQGVTAVLRLAGGLVADRRQNHKGVAAAGYALSAACKLGLLAAAGAWLWSTAILFVDRLGKGIRTAPRDALISLSAPRAALAEAFGVHRALDTAGACLGPVVAFGLLYVAPGAFDSVFVVSFCAAAVGLGVLVVFVDNRGREAEATEARSIASLRAAFRLLRARPFRTLALVGTGLALATISDSFVYLVFQRRADIDLMFFPLLYVGTALVYLLLSVPVGRVADRVGRGRVFVGGYVALLLLYGVLLLPTPGAAAVIGGIVLFGAYYAATDGVLMALASEAVPVHLRTSGLALLTTGVAIARLVSALLFGALWSWYGPEWTVAAFLLTMAAGIPIAAVCLHRAPPGGSVAEIA
jgi:MFS family permease